MSSIKMIALRKHPFGTGERAAGEEYEATADESAILIALGWAKKSLCKEELASEEAGSAAAPAQLKPVDEPSKKNEKAKSAEKDQSAQTKRTYQRRDMKAQG